MGSKPCQTRILCFCRGKKRQTSEEKALQSFGQHSPRSWALSYFLRPEKMGKTLNDGDPSFMAQWTGFNILLGTGGLWGLKGDHTVFPVATVCHREVEGQGFKSFTHLGHLFSGWSSPDLHSEILAIKPSDDFSFALPGPSTNQHLVLVWKIGAALPGASSGRSRIIRTLKRTQRCIFSP